MRKALVVGNNYYRHFQPLFGCVDDALSVKNTLERNSDGTVNFDVRSLIGTSPDQVVTRNELRDQAQELFSTELEAALFYFAGHGDLQTTGGYLIASDSERADNGLPLSDLLTFANQSRAHNRIIVLDSCHSGIAGAATSSLSHASEITEGLTILTASTADQYASEENGQGIFTGLFVDALNGAAANLVGAITPGSVYAHIDQSLGPWEQRPVFKTNVKSFVSLRRVQAPIELADLHRLPELFPEPGYVFPLDPSYEPEMNGRDPALPAPDPQKTVVFRILQRYLRVNLLVPEGAPHMYHAAMESQACRLTVLGQHYRRLVERNRI